MKKKKQKSLQEGSYISLFFCLLPTIYNLYGLFIKNNSHGRVSKYNPINLVHCKNQKPLSGGEKRVIR